MKITRLLIENFRGIRRAELKNIDSMVIVAGSNGSGKSCVFDAIRLLKSMYGGYQPNEWHQWINEFQIRIDNNSIEANHFSTIFNDSEKPLKIECSFELNESEVHYLKANSFSVLNVLALRADGAGPATHLRAPILAQGATHDARIRLSSEQLLSELESPTLEAHLHIPSGGLPTLKESVALATVFSTFRPKDIGTIDYHGPNRNYSREYVQNVNLDLSSSPHRQGQTALYNYSNKYNNIKSELASAYLHDLLAEKAGVESNKSGSLNNSMKELFRTFFPNKEFLGPQATVEGKINFIVKIGESGGHDLDDLSAGEKEIIYGYLRMRDSAPSNSIILLDEPELHLNPKLTRELPAFYKKHLGEKLNNQFWMVTHSDAIIREVVGRPGYQVFHMLPSTDPQADENQLRALSAEEEVELALVDMVGDLASYLPHGRVVIFEGGGDSEFDVTMVSKLFPELANSASLVSGTNKVRVRALHEVLRKIESKSAYSFYSITDKDSDPLLNNQLTNTFQWDVYHIENYLLEPSYISLAMKVANSKATLNDQEILLALHDCAKELLDKQVMEQLVNIANASLLKCIDVGADPNIPNAGKQISEAIRRSLDRAGKSSAGNLSEEELDKSEKIIRSEYLNSLSSDEWIKTFPGRSILKRFSKKYTQAKYEVFRNIILDQMKSDNYKPVGMAKVINKITI